MYATIRYYNNELAWRKVGSFGEGALLCKFRANGYNVVIPTIKCKIIEHIVS